MQGFWTEERLKLLTAWWQAGESASVIARQIGDGCTRNAVVAKVHRLGIVSPNSTGPTTKIHNRMSARAGNRWHSAVNPKNTKKGPAVVDFKQSDAEPPPLGENRGEHIAGRCDWIHGHPNSGENWRRCGHPVEAERVYCGWHYRKTVQPKYVLGADRGVSKDWLDAQTQRQFQKVALG